MPPPVLPAALHPTPSPGHHGPARAQSSTPKVWLPDRKVPVLSSFFPPKTSSLHKALIFPKVLRLLLHVGHGIDNCLLVLK